MRFIEELCPLTIRLLSRIYKQSKKHHVRQRAHCILLSAQGVSVSQLANIFGVTPRTIYTWFDRWEIHRFAGLYDQKGRGREPKLNGTQQSQVKAWVKAFPKRLGKVIALVQEQFGISVSKRTLQRVLRAREFTWRRVRKKAKGEPDPVEYAHKKQELEAYEKQAEQGCIDLYYLDETGFCLDPYIPYAWQEKGETIEVEASGGKRLNVLGFLSLQLDLVAYTTEGHIDSDFVIACLDVFCQGLTKKTVMVMDNASFHTSDAIEAKIPEWKRNNLELFYLPKYSPQLNLIEILWRFMKYEWIDWSAYQGWHYLVKYVEQIICGYGTEYEINFV